MPSNCLLLCCPILLLLSIFPSIRLFRSESALRIRWLRYWSFSFSISPSNEYSGLISFRTGRFISLLFKGLSRIFSITTVWKYLFFGTQLSLWSNSHIHTWLLEKPQLWLVGPLSAKWCLLFNTLCRFVIFFSKEQGFVISFTKSRTVEETPHFCENRLFQSYYHLLCSFKIKYVI